MYASGYNRWLGGLLYFAILSSPCVEKTAELPSSYVVLERNPFSVGFTE